MCDKTLSLSALNCVFLNVRINHLVLYCFQEFMNLTIALPQNKF